MPNHWATKEALAEARYEEARAYCKLVDARCSMYMSTRWAWLHKLRVRRWERLLTWWRLKVEVLERDARGPAGHHLTVVDGGKARGGDA